MRTNDAVYWSTSLPKDHEALQALDAYCKEWGGLTRAEATRRLLIEWERLRTGREVSSWVQTVPTKGAVPAAPEGSRRAGAQKSPLSTSAAKAASHVLDD